MPLTGSYTNDVQYLIEVSENEPLANGTITTDIPTLDSEDRPVIGFGYDLLANAGNILGNLSAAGIVLTSAQQTALSNFLSNNAKAPYTASQLTTLQGLIPPITYNEAVALMQNSIATAESGLDTHTKSRGIGIIPDSNERAALVDMYYQLPGGGGVNGKNGYFYNKNDSFTHLSLFNSGVTSRFRRGRLQHSVCKRTVAWSSSSPLEARWGRCV